MENSCFPCFPCFLPWSTRKTLKTRKTAVFSFPLFSVFHVTPRLVQEQNRTLYVRSVLFFLSSARLAVYCRLAQRVVQNRTERSEVLFCTSAGSLLRFLLPLPAFCTCFPLGPWGPGACSCSFSTPRAQRSVLGGERSAATNDDVAALLATLVASLLRSNTTW